MYLRRASLRKWSLPPTTGHSQKSADKLETRWFLHRGQRATVEVGTQLSVSPSVCPNSNQYLNVLFDLTSPPCLNDTSWTCSTYV